MNKLLDVSISGFISISLTFALMEVYTYVLPVSDYIPFEKPILCNSSNVDIECFRRRSRSGFYSKGSLAPAEIQSKKHINDIKQFSNVNFFDLLNSKNPKIISVGDSYVEALQVNNEHTFHHKLNHITNQYTDKKYVSTAFGASGMSFPNYIKYIEYIQDHLNPNEYTLIIPVIKNDFEDAFVKIGSDKQGSFFFTQDGQFKFEPLEEDQSIISKILSYSRVARLLFLNMEVQNLPTRLFAKYSDDQILMELPENKYPKEGESATNIFFNKLNELRKSKHSRLHTIFILDSDRPFIYEQDGEEDVDFERRRIYFKTQAESHGYSVIDTEPRFTDSYKSSNIRSEFKIDPHWNKHGHNLVFELIAEKLSSF